MKLCLKTKFFLTIRSFYRNTFKNTPVNIKIYKKHFDHISSRHILNTNLGKRRPHLRTTILFINNIAFRCTFNQSFCAPRLIIQSILIFIVDLPIHSFLSNIMMEGARTPTNFDLIQGS